MEQQIIPFKLNPLFIQSLGALTLLIADKKRKPFHAAEISKQIYTGKILIEQYFGLYLN